LAATLQQEFFPAKRTPLKPSHFETIENLIFGHNSAGEIPLQCSRHLICMQLSFWAFG
jgi:hypothetical protein